MTSARPQDDWLARVNKKKSESETIPAAWIIPQHVRAAWNADSEINVLSVPQQSGILSRKELEITEKYSAVSLVQKLKNKEFSSHEVTLAFCKRAAIAHQVVNCLTETLFERALARAKFLDDYLAREGKVFGPFHGLPISVKDTFNIKGVPTTIGYVSFIGPPADFNSPLISMLEGQGAVLYVKTNVPQTLLAPDTNNNVFGRTLNPYNLARTAGGSSGGEGALVGMHGSPLGVGSDMAGSIRIPAFCNGAFGLKPTEHRVPYDGQGRPDRPGLFGPVFPVAGPIARSARDMTFFLRNVMNGHPDKVDYTSPPIPWRAVTIDRPLRIGLIVACHSSAITETIRDSVLGAAKLLKEAGHFVVQLQKFPDFQKAHDLSYKLFDMDNKQTGLRHIDASGEPMVEATRDLNPDYPGPRVHRELEDLWCLNVERQKVMAEWHAIIQDKSLDIILAPAGKRTAPTHDIMRSCPYMVMWNLVNYVAAVLPIGGILGKSRISNIGPEVGSSEAPSHIQLVAPSFRDEELAAAAELVSDVLHQSDIMKL